MLDGVVTGLTVGLVVVDGIFVVLDILVLRVDTIVVTGLVVKVFFVILVVVTLVFLVVVLLVVAASTKQKFKSIPVFGVIELTHLVAEDVNVEQPR